MPLSPARSRRDSSAFNRARARARSLGVSGAGAVSGGLPSITSGGFAYVRGQPTPKSALTFQSPLGCLAQTEKNQPVRGVSAGSFGRYSHGPVENARPEDAAATHAGAQESTPGARGFP